MGDETQLIVFCEGCGERVVVSMARGPASTTREPDSSATPGRVTIREGGPDGPAIHQCAPGAYVRPAEKAPPKRG